MIETCRWEFKECRKAVRGTDGIWNKTNRYLKCEILEIRLVPASLRVNDRITMFRPTASRERSIVLYVIPLLLFLQLSFSENGFDRSSEGKEKVVETWQICHGKKVGFGSQSMKITKAPSRGCFLSLRDR